VRLSEDDTFAGVFFEALVPTLPFQLSDGGGLKTVYGQFKSATGAVSAPIPVVIEYVDQGPMVDGFSIAEGQVIVRPLNVDISFTSTFDIDHIDLLLDDGVLTSSTADAFSYYWDPRNEASGVHTLSLLAVDTAANEERVDRSITIALEPPPAPVIIFPVTGSVLAAPVITVTGTSERFIDVRVTRNGTTMGTVAAAVDGTFSLPGVSLNEGTNDIAAFAEDVIGISPRSSLVTVELDTGAPEAPTLLEALPRAGGLGVRLLWQAPISGEVPSVYDVYRSDTPFATLGAAIRVVEGVEGTTAIDDTVTDGTWYYSVVGVDGAGNPSVLSNQLVVVYDATAPTFTIVYDTPSPVGVS
jgi:hypothetical protein